MPDDSHQACGWQRKEGYYRLRHATTAVFLEVVACVVLLPVMAGCCIATSESASAVLNSLAMFRHVVLTGLSVLERVHTAGMKHHSEVATAAPLLVIMQFVSSAHLAVTQVAAHRGHP